MSIFVSHYVMLSVLSITISCLSLCNCKDCSTSGFPVLRDSSSSCPLSRWRCRFLLPFSASGSFPKSWIKRLFAIEYQYQLCQNTKTKQKQYLSRCLVSLQKLGERKCWWLNDIISLRPGVSMNLCFTWAEEWHSYFKAGLNNIYGPQVMQTHEAWLQTVHFFF